MFKHIRGYGLAPWIVPCAALVLASLFFVIIIESRSYRERVYHEYATAEADADAQGKFAIECSKLATVEEVRQCFEDVIESSREPQRAEEDLYAQKQMAQWAYWLFVVSSLIGVMSVGVAIGGVYWVHRTWQLQRRATEESTKATLAAVEANKFQRRAFVAEQRAWIPIRQQDISIYRPLRWQGDSANLTIQIVIRNTGQYPAQAVWLKTAMQLQTMAEIFPANFAADARAEAMRYSHNVVFPGDSVGYRYLTILHTHDLESYAAEVSRNIGRTMLWEDIELYPKFIACIDYGIVSKRDRRHTMVAADILRRKNGQILPIRWVDGTIPADELMLEVLQIVAD